MKYNIDKAKKDTIIQRVSTYLLSECPDIVAVYVFGSFMTSKPFSDIDLALLVGENIPSPLVFELGLEVALPKLTEIPVDVRILNGAPLSFVQNVIRNGKVIIDKDPNHRADFEGRKLKEYFDFSRFYRRYLREVVNAPI